MRDLLGNVWCCSTRLCFVHALVNGDVHLLNKNAVSWDSVALLNVDDISNDQVSDGDRCAGSMAASVNNDGLVVDFILQFKELSLFDPVTGSRNERCKK